MKSRLLLLFLMFLVCLSGFAQTSRRYVTLPFHPNAETNSATIAPATVPMWTGTTDGYTYRMVGQSPLSALTTQTTTIGVWVVPLILTFSDGTTFDPTVTDAVCSTQGSAASLLLQSPIFNNYQYSPGGTNVGNTQYEDFFQRANFYQYTNASGVNPNYHLLLAPTALGAIKIAVPAASGSTVKANCGRLGQIDINWLDNYLQGTAFKQLAGLGVLPSNMVVFQMYNIAGYDTSVSTCCILGYHSAFNNPNYSNAVQTYAVADFDTTGNFSPTRDVSPLSHELGEWMDDPLGNNPTPAWGHTGEVTGCQSNLEVGDPLTGTDIAITMSNTYTYHVQELAFLSWFYHQTPSIGVNGWYSSNDSFKTYAGACYDTRTTLSISPATLAAGAAATVAITVKPSSGTTTATPTGTVTLIPGSTGKAVATYTLTAGAVSATVSDLPSGNYAVTADYGGDSTFSASVSAPVMMSVGTATVSLSPVALFFGNESVGSATAAQSVTLANKGTAPLGSIAISLAGASPGDFSRTTTCGATLAAGANCSIAVEFKPTAAGLRTATVSIADNGTGSPQTVPVSGTGVSTAPGAVTLSPGMLSFGSQNLATASVTQTVTITNSGTGTLTLDSMNFQGADPGDFTGSSKCGRSLAAGATCTVAVAFRPMATGARSATLSITDNASGSPQSVALSGTGVNTGTPAVTLSPASLTFANQAAGTQTITLTNSGTGALPITSVTLTGTDPGDFAIGNNCPALLAGGAACRISVSFRPEATGTLTASVSIADSAGGSPQTVAVSGTATSAVPSPGKPVR